jgi:hypothetical protein
MQEKKLTRKQGYYSLYWFLDRIWKQSKTLYPDDLPSLLSHINPFLWGDEGSSIDPAINQDWENVWGDNENLFSEEVYQVGRRFIEFYNSFGSQPEIDYLLKHWEDGAYKSLWIKTVEQVLGE